jgi:putative DNA primase/helicase
MFEVPIANDRKKGQRGGEATLTFVRENRPTIEQIIARGLPCFPVRLRWNVEKQKLEKIPAIKNWQTNPPRTPEEIRAAFAMPGWDVVGIPTGAISGIDALDIDPRHGGDKWLRENPGRLPITRTQITQSGGAHLIFKHTDGVRNSTGTIAPGIDVRGDGGYIVDWSLSDYKVLNADVLAEWPDWLLPLIRKDASRGNGAHGEATSVRPNGSVFSDLRRPVSLTAAAANVYTPPSWSEMEETRVRSALNFLPAYNREDWLHRGMELHWLGWDERGYTLWDEWSRKCREKYNEEDQRKTWEGFDRCDPSQRRRTIASLYHEARERGWIDIVLKNSEADFHTDLGNARRLIARHGADIRFVPEWGKWLIWDKTHWRVDQDGAIMRLAKETVRAMYAEAGTLNDAHKRAELGKHALKCEAETRLDAMVSLAETEEEVLLPAHRVDADPWLLGVQNGVVDLQTGKFRAAERGDFITKRAGVAFDPEARCPNWLAFIETITGSNRPLAAYHQRVVGYTLTGSTCEEVLFVLYGIGNNGKSTWRETLHDLMGDYAMAADAGLLVERKTPGGASPELARLKGRRMVAINETAENDKLNEARVKFITSQDKITARNLYEGFFDFVPTHKTFLTTNHKPVIRGTDVGIWRRIHLLPFTITIPQEKVVKDFRALRLIPELPGILNWALAGLIDYSNRGLDPPEAVQAATSEYRHDMDVVGQWIDERCILDPQATVPTAVAYSDYQQWAQSEIGWELTRLKFRRNLTDRGFGAAKGTGGQRMTTGLSLKSTPPLYEAGRRPPRRGASGG